MAKNTNKDADAKVANASANVDNTAAANQADANADAAASAQANDADAGPKAEYDYVVISRFKDKNDSSKIYEKGDTVNRFGEERLNDLMTRKPYPLVERRPKA